MNFEMVIATSNEHKVNEYRKMLSPYGITLYSFKDLNIEVEDVEENGKSFIENALIKANHAAKYTKFPVIADDSGVCVDSLDGFPGLITARFAHSLGGQKYANIKLVEMLNGKDRSASFKCAIALANIPGGPRVFEGEARGHIVEKYNNEESFGYDPVFYYDELGKTFHEMDKDTKNKISHRGRAVKKLITCLKVLGYINK